MPLAIVWCCAPGGRALLLSRVAANQSTRRDLSLRDDDFVQEFRRITMDPDVMGGKPCVRGMRVTVGMIVEALSAGRTNEQLLS